MKRALVVGSSGGIGQAMTKELTNQGYDVVPLSRRNDGLDVTDASSVHGLIGKLQGPFDIIFIATGILAPERRSPEKSLNAIDGHVMASVMAVNTIGVALILREVPRLLPLNARSVTAVLTARVGSIGDNQIGGWYSYRASKAAANQLVHGAAIEIARKRPKAIVAAFHPGTVDTPFTANYSVEGKFPPDTAAKYLLSVMSQLTEQQTGGFFDYKGHEVAW